MQALASAIEGKMTSIATLCHVCSKYDCAQVILGAQRSSTRTQLLGWRPYSRLAVAMDNEREQVLGQFGSVTGPAKVLEVLQDGASFGHAVSAGRHLWKAIQVVIAVVFLCVKLCVVLQVEDTQPDTRG